MKQIIQTYQLKKKRIFVRRLKDSKKQVNKPLITKQTKCKRKNIMNKWTKYTKN